MSSDPIHLATELRSFYHGTNKSAADSILRQGFRGWSWINDNCMHICLGRRSGDRYQHGGLLGGGTYVTCDWKVGLFFGPVLFRVELQPGTRLLCLDVSPEQKVLKRLKREFGHEILHRNPLKVMPRNKHLTLEEVVQLARHHSKLRVKSDTNLNSWQFHKDRLMELRPILMRYGIHGWGESNDLNGIAIFNTDRIRPREVLVSLPSDKLYDACYDYHRSDGPHASINAMIDTMYHSYSPEAQDNLRWFHEANRSLAA